MHNFWNTLYNWPYTFLQAAKEDKVNVDVGKVMNTWLKQMGYPVVTVTRDYAAKTAKVTQKRFLLNPSQTSDSKYPSPYG